MRIDKYLRFIAGFFILSSLILAQVHSEYWLFFTAFVGLNQLQSGITNWCLMMVIVKKIFGKERCEEIIVKSCATN